MGGKKGFTLVEMTVVMAIVAMLSLIGVAMLSNLKNESMLDTATQDIISSIREAQNKAFSVADVQGGGGVIPVAWGVKVNASDSSITPFWVKPIYTTPPTATVEYLNPLKKSYSAVTIVGSGFFTFSAPFGKYYSSTSVPTGWEQKTTRPNDFAPATATPGPTTLTLTYRTSSRTITIDPANGDVYAN